MLCIILEKSFLLISKWEGADIYPQTRARKIHALLDWNGPCKLSYSICPDVFESIWLRSGIVDKLYSVR